MTRVYVVEDENGAWAAFTDGTAAKRYADLSERYVHAVDLDPAITLTDDGMAAFRVRVAVQHGTILRDGMPLLTARRTDGGIEVESHLHPSLNAHAEWVPEGFAADDDGRVDVQRDSVVFGVWARDRAHAKEIGKARAASLLESGEWPMPPSPAPPDDYAHTLVVAFGLDENGDIVAKETAP